MKIKQNNPWIITGVLVFGALVATFNETVLNVTLRVIADDMQISLADAQWLITGYMLITAVMVPVTAFLYQSIPTQRLYTGALLAITAGALGCLLAQSFPMLLSWRMLQAMGTGMMIPIMQNTVLIIAPKDKLGTAMACCLCGTLLGPALGPAVAGIIINNFPWRSIYILILFLLAPALLAGVFFVKNVSPLTRPALDVLSVILSTAGLSALLYGISITGSQALPGVTFILAGTIFTAWFIFRQGKLREPLLNLAPFANPNFRLGIILLFIIVMVSFSINISVPSFLQGAFGVTYRDSALLLLPAVLLNAVSTSISGKILDKYGVAFMLPASFILFTIMLLLLSEFSTGSSLTSIMVVCIFIYQGVAFSLSPAQTSALQTLPPELYSHGVAIANTFIQIAASVGSSLSGSIQSVRLAEAASAGLPEPSAVAYGFSGAVFSLAAIGMAGIILSFLLSFRIMKH